MVKRLAEKYDGIACEENYHESLMGGLDWNEFPNLGYTANLKDWADFIRRTPDEYAKWIEDVAKECEILELRILEDLVKTTDKKIFVDTNISLETLGKITDKDHVLIMLADPSISVSRFFDRPDSEKQFLYQLLLKEKNPDSSNWPRRYPMLLTVTSRSMMPGRPARWEKEELKSEQPLRNLLYRP